MAITKNLWGKQILNGFNSIHDNSLVDIKVQGGENGIGIAETEYCKKVVGAETCANMLYEYLFVLIVMYGSETLIWRKKDRSRINDVQMDNLSHLLGIMKIHRIPKAWVSTG